MTGHGRMVRLPFVRLVVVTALGFALAMTANTLEPSVLGRKILQLAPANPNTALGFTTLGGLLVAILVQPVIGALSDRTRSPWGRRLPYMVGGGLAACACLLLVAAAPVFGLVVAGVLLLQLASNTVQAPWQALIPDLVPAAQRGQAAGLKALFDILAFVAGRGAGGWFLSHYADWGQAAVLAAVAMPIAVYVGALAVTVIGAREERAAVAVERSTGAALTEAFSVDLRSHPAFRWWFINRLFFWSAFIALNTFLLFYLMNVIGLAEGPANAFIGRLSLVLGGAVALAVIPSGWLADHVGRRPLLVAAGLAAAAGTVGILLARTPGPLTAAGAVVGLSIGTFLTANWALIADIVPQHQAAHYMGVANIAGAGGSALARLLGGALIDPINRLAGSSSTGYLAVYAIAAVFFLCSALAVLPLARPHASAAAEPGTGLGQMLAGG